MITANCLACLVKQQHQQEQPTANKGLRTAPKSQSNNHIAVDKHSTRRERESWLTPEETWAQKERKGKKERGFKEVLYKTVGTTSLNTPDKDTLSPQSVSDTDRQTDRVSGCCTIRASESAGERRTKMKRKDSSHCCTTQHSHCQLTGLLQQ